ncbi:MAG: sulfatase-like hydrolase/transferase [Paludibaculum sp.]
MAESLAAAGYQTGLFGKWHLGEQLPPARHGSGLPDRPHPARRTRSARLPAQYRLLRSAAGTERPPRHPQGYCSDIFFDEAMQFIEKNRRRPFFTYISTNAPAYPAGSLKEEWAEPYRKAGLDETTAKIYGMVGNIDSNIGRLITHLHLRRLRLDQNTLLWFMTDNGPQQPRSNAGLRGLKTTSYEGGIRAPSFLALADEDPAGHQGLAARRPHRLPAHCARRLRSALAQGPQDRWPARCWLRPSSVPSSSSGTAGDAPEEFRELRPSGPIVGSSSAPTTRVEPTDLPNDPGEVKKNLAASEPAVPPASSGSSTTPGSPTSRPNAATIRPASLSACRTRTQSSFRVRIGADHRPPGMRTAWVTMKSTCVVLQSSK